MHTPFQQPLRPGNNQIKTRMQIFSIFCAIQFTLLTSGEIEAKTYTVGNLDQGNVSTMKGEGSPDNPDYERLMREEALRKVMTEEEIKRKEILLNNLRSEQLQHPRVRISELHKFSKNGSVINRKNAVYFADINNDFIDEAICAFTKGTNAGQMTFLVIFAAKKTNYIKKWQSPIFPGTLWIQNRRTAGFQILDQGMTDYPRIVIATTVSTGEGCSLSVIQYSTNSLSYSVFELPGRRRLEQFFFDDIDDDGINELRAIPFSVNISGSGENAGRFPIIFKWGPKGYIETEKSTGL